ncbi:hypothetical protein [uncultured Allobaculum sp.]|uniref:hypothetical protein n=1 Tax=uncultured Allobaculum sp. TaxID=1187017 RepID=UPI0025952FBD|nr:hypothetical protein [uncultured Allobaculum sp.]
MKNWQKFAAAALAGSMLLAGCGDGGETADASKASGDGSKGSVYYLNVSVK